jgi:hypothetical protein
MTWIVLLLIIVWVVCGVFTAIVASSKGRGTWGWFFAGFLFGPIALFAVGFMPAAIAGAMQRKCPACAELILREAKRCKHCGAEVEPLPELPSIPSPGAAGGNPEHQTLVLIALGVAVFAAILMVVFSY